MDATAVVPKAASIVLAHSSNIDHNAFDKTINFSSIASNSAAPISDVSQQHDQSDILFKSSIAFQSHQSESNITDEHILEVPSVESFVKSSNEEQLDVVANQSNNKIILTKAENTEENLNVYESPTSADPISPMKVYELNFSSSDDSQSPMKVLDTIISDVASPEINVPTEDFPIDAVEVNQMPVENLNVTVEITSDPIESTNTQIVEEVNVTENEVPTNENVPVESADDALIHNEAPLNVTADLVSKNIEENLIEKESAPNATNDNENIVSEEKPVESVQEVEIPVAAVNQTFEAMDIDMNETVDLQQPIENLAESQQFNANPIENPLLNQTVEMADLDQADEVEKPALNVTVDICQPKSTESNQQKTELNEKPSSIGSPEIVEASETSEVHETEFVAEKMMNSTEDFEHKPKTVLNETINITSSKNTSAVQVESANMNETFLNNSTAFNQTHNLSKDLLSSTRRSLDVANKSSVLLPNVNLNETIVVDNKPPSMNTSYIVCPKTVETPSNGCDLMQTSSEQQDDLFKMPTKPAKSSNPFADLKSKTQNFEVSDDEFQSPGRKFLFFVIYFDFFFRYICCFSFRSIVFGSKF